MFDKHIHPPTGLSHVEITEKRAPTTDSVRLLREMEASARDSITNSVRVKSTEIDCVVHTYDDFVNDSIKLGVVLKLNGKRIVVELSVHNPCTEDYVSEQAVEAVSRRIAAEVLAPVFHKAFKGMK